MTNENGASSTNGKDDPASNNESEIYDRQIRLWGAESQVISVISVEIHCLAIMPIVLKQLLVCRTIIIALI